MLLLTLEFINDFQEGLAFLCCSCFCECSHF